jgi:hypothetical protein
MQALFYEVVEKIQDMAEEQTLINEFGENYIEDNDFKITVNDFIENHMFNLSNTVEMEVFNIAVDYVSYLDEVSSL